MSHRYNNVHRLANKVFLKPKTLSIGNELSIQEIFQYNKTIFQVCFSVQFSVAPLYEVDFSLNEATGFRGIAPTFTYFHNFNNKQDS